MKDTIANPEPPAEEETTEEPLSIGPDLLVGGFRKATRNEILASVPSRSMVDRMVDAYFTNADMGTSESTSFKSPSLS